MSVKSDTAKQAFQRVKAAAEALKKFQSGGKLTKAEESLIAEMGGESDAPSPSRKLPSVAKNKTDLAKILFPDESLPTARKRINRAAKLPGWPSAKANGEWPVESCRKFIADNTSLLDEDDEELATMKLAIATEQARKLKIANDEAEGLLTRMEDLAAAASPALAAIKDALYQKLENEIPIATAGVDVAQARIIGKRVADELLRKWQEVFRAWQV